MAADLDDKIAAAESNVKESQNLFGAYGQRDDDRFAIAKLIVWSFVIFVGAVILAVAMGAALYDWPDVAEPAKTLVAVLGSVMLPVVTLVIGYYFGSK
jgi:hypothetical protein